MCPRILGRYCIHGRPRVKLAVTSSTRRALTRVALSLAILLAAPAHTGPAPSLMSPVGEAADDFFGWSVSGAGDFNGDGFADVIVGAPDNDAGGNRAGRAYVYHGGPGSDAIADLILTGEAASNRFGHSVSGAGDVNGDGFADVIVGAYENSAGGLFAGRAYVFYGGPGADAVADLTLTGEEQLDAFGVSVSGAGDVNGDGFADVIVGASSNDAGGDINDNRGRAYVYYGGPGADEVADLTLTGELPGDTFGRSVSGVGDVDGDGFPDVIVGAIGNDTGGSDAGRAYVYFGGPAVDAAADLTLTGEAASDLFGFSVSGAGDLNGDGFADLIVGALQNDAGGGDAGRAYVYFGGPAADAMVDLTITGEGPGDLLGRSVSCAGDVNGDGYADAIVGANRNATGGIDAGQAYVFYGGPGVDAVADLTLTGEVAGDSFGFSVSGAGDVDGDGRGDMIIGATANDDGGDRAGKAYVHGVDIATPVLLWLFTAEVTDDGVELRWRFGDGTMFSEVALERSASQEGPWRAVVPERWREHAVTVALDREIPAGGTYYYRLQAADSRGQTTTFPPIKVTVGEQLVASRLERITPNPTNGPARLDFTVVNEAWVSLTVLDVNGREVSCLVDEQVQPGRYQLMWSGQGANGELPPGVYFVRLEVGVTRMARRVIVAR